MSCPVSHKTQIGEATKLKRNRGAQRQSCPVKSLNLATAAARGELGIPWDFLHSVLQGLSRATREAVRRNDSPKNPFNFQFRRMKCQVSAKVLKDTRSFCQKSALSFPQRPQWDGTH
ncbi:hypothetical protein TNCV_1661351 [Trichonephila clavipes]|nr:hypothetical protein TNCV_1661351 [Trichonephila clavipes]